MDIAGQYDVGSAQPRRRRDDALANAGRIDAHDRGVLENPRARPPRERRKAVDIFAAVDLKRLRIIHAVEIMIGPELGSHAIDLPALHFRLEILAEHLQAGDQLIANLDVGHLQRALAERNARHQFFGRIGPDIFGAFPRQRPEFAGCPRSRYARSDRRSADRSPASPCRADGRKRSSRHAGLRAPRRWRRALPLPAPPSARQGRRRPRRCRHPGRTTAASAPVGLRHRVR